MKINELTTDSKIIAFHNELHRRFMKLCNVKTNHIRQIRGLERKSAMREVIIHRLTAELAKFSDFDYKAEIEGQLSQLG